MLLELVQIKTNNNNFHIFNKIYKVTSYRNKLSVNILIKFETRDLLTKRLRRMTCKE